MQKEYQVLLEPILSEVVISKSFSYADAKEGNDLENGLTNKEAKIRYDRDG